MGREDGGRGVEGGEGGREISIVLCGKGSTN